MQIDSQDRQPHKTEPSYQTYYLLYQSKYHNEITQAVTSIAKVYATFKWLQFSDDLYKEITQHYHQIKLTKRTIIFAILTPDNPEAPPNGSKQIIYSDHADTNRNEIFIDKETKIDQVVAESVKLLKLDSVWVGFLSRIGTDVQQFQDYLIESESFQSFEISSFRHFYQKLQEKLNKNHAFSLDTLSQCKQQLVNQEVTYNFKAEELVRSWFNARIIIKDIANYSYINLLASRGFFNLIFIEASITNRFKHFKNKTARHYPRIKSTLNFENFILLDQYIYSQFLFSCLSKVKKYINRLSEREPYSQIVKKYHKDIIRQFRPSFHEYFLGICLVLKSRAACLKQSVGSIIVKDSRIISTGYNGTPRGTINCYNGGCVVCNNSQKIGTEVLSCRCIHAEYNCILLAGITLTPGSTLYSSKIPCLWCAKLIIQGRIKEVIYISSNYCSLEYENSEMIMKTFKDGKVNLIEFDFPFNK